MSENYRQDPHLPFAMGQGIAQPNDMLLAHSYGFDRGKGIGPGFAPNSQMLPDGWLLWDPGAVLAGPPWVDASRREGVIRANPNNEGAQRLSLGGFIQRLPQALIDSPEFWIYAECGCFYQKLSDDPDDTNGELCRCGIAVFEDQGAVLPGGDPPLITAGVLLGGNSTSAFAFGVGTVWGDHHSGGLDMMSFGAYLTQRIHVRMRVQQTIGLTIGFSTDGGKHWVDSSPKPMERIRWIGFVASAVHSNNFPESDIETFASCSAISIFTPPNPGNLNETLAAQGGERTI